MSGVRDDILALIAKYGSRNVTVAEGTDIFRECSIEGDDAFEFMAEFGAKFHVDPSHYLWYFHHGEEGYNPASLIFPPPYMRVKRMPITLPTLIRAAEENRWPLEYPAHTLPKTRWDVRLNLGCLGLMALLGVGLLALQQIN